MGTPSDGKSTLLRQCYPKSRWLDLLKADEFRRYVDKPESLRLEIEKEGLPEQGSQIVIDEIQKVPALLDEVHWLIRKLRLPFCLVRVECAQGEAWRCQLVGRAGGPIRVVRLDGK